VGVRCKLPARSYSQWHPLVWITGGGTLLRGGAPQLTGLGGPAGPVGPVGTTDRPYMGMDPSDPTTYVRQYRPVAGMVAVLNFDGAAPQQAQTVKGPKRWRGLK
jgi:hypothetical protein